MIPAWLNGIAWFSLIAALFCTAVIAIDVLRNPQKMAIMNWVWPITALYAGVIRYLMRSIWGARSFGFSP